MQIIKPPWWGLGPQARYALLALSLGGCVLVQQAAPEWSSAAVKTQLAIISSALIHVLWLIIQRCWTALQQFWSDLRQLAARARDPQHERPETLRGTNGTPDDSGSV
ncbi:hypothetical protein [Streptomyces sp. NPDC058475]|uniref:hypothetical protein n=1 Tax=Streptomyces sp. NPDC058475 TaxID=3346518 RepID=UPI0036554C1C